MTEEEMAEQFADNISGLELTCSLLSAKDKSHAYRLGRYDGFLAGLKAGRPQWHDLRKDPDDLPKATTPVLVILDSGVRYVSWISSDKGWWFCTNYATGEDKVIKWREIPTFDKE